MALTKEQIRAAALELNPDDREILAVELLHSLPRDPVEEDDREFLAEIERREADLASGKTHAVPAFNVVDRLLKRAKS